MKIPLKTLIFALTICIAVCSCSTTPNLTLVKSKLRTYHDSGEYDREISLIVKEAQRYALTKSKIHVKCAMVLDIDDTALSNWDYMSEFDFGYEKQHYEGWVSKGNAPAIAPVLNAYRSIQNLGFSIFFISGREERLREATTRNLLAVGFTNWSGLYLRPERDGHKSLAEYKTEVRREIEKEGYRIVINIGDQTSDLAGGFAKRKYKLPNPFYLSN